VVRGRDAGADRRPLHLAGRRVDPRRHVCGDHRRACGVDRRDDPDERFADDALEARPEQRIDDGTGARECRRIERTRRRPGQAVEVRPRHTGEAVQRKRGDHVDLVPGFPEETGRDQAVSSVVARPDHDADGSPSGDLGRGRRQPRSGLLGEFQFQDAAPLHREAIRRPHLVRVVESVEPSGQGSPCPLFLHVSTLPGATYVGRSLVS
jgi:hypothetical protein